MSTKRELVEAEDAGWAELWGLLGSMDVATFEKPGCEGDWSAKDLMAHIAGWFAETVQVLEQIRFGTYRPFDYDVDELNARFVEANRDQPGPVVRAELAASRNRMLEEFNLLPELTPAAEEWFRESGPEHYQEHLPRLREWAEELQVSSLRRLGVMGGTFDPIHQGHLVTAEAALWEFHLERVIFVPTGQPWMKADRKVSPAEDRYLMTVIATSSNPRFSVSRVDIERDGPTYTVDTLRQLRGQYEQEVELYFITGADAMLEILSWKDPEEAMSEAHFIAATRPGYDIARFEKEAPTSHPKVSVLNIPALAISSSDIRRRVRSGEPIRYLVPEGVQTYIEKAGLYTEPD
jgi:nicotinate-nucleotide adenylyltransferase